jgi:hypothetical protein
LAGFRYISPTDEVEKGVSMREQVERHGEYQRPTLTQYGTIEEWTKAPCTELVCISIILP